MQCLTNFYVIQNLAKLLISGLLVSERSAIGRSGVSAQLFTLIWLFERDLAQINLFITHVLLFSHSILKDVHRGSTRLLKLTFD